MSNPLNQGQQPHPLNPQFTQMLQQPGAQQFLNQLLQQNPGKSPRELAYHIAQQKGISQDQLSQLMSRFGLN